MVELDARTCLNFGVDCLAAGGRSAPQARLAPTATPDAPVADEAPPVRERNTPAPTNADHAARSDRDRAAGELQLLRERYEKEAPHQHFKTDHTHIVWGEGDPRARLMFVGEAPGAEEDKTGRPFVGRAGQLLDKMISAMGLAREQVYIANVLKTRPPNNATPTSFEADLCSPYLFEQIRIVSPEAIVALGLPATRTLLATQQSMSDLRGRWAVFTDPAGREIPVMPTYHPAFILRAPTPENRRKVWSDLQQVMDRLGLERPDNGPPA